MIIEMLFIRFVRRFLQPKKRQLFFRLSFCAVMRWFDTRIRIESANEKLKHKSWACTTHNFWLKSGTPDTIVWQGFHFIRMYVNQVLNSLDRVPQPNRTKPNGTEQPSEKRTKTREQNSIHLIYVHSLTLNTERMSAVAISLSFLLTFDSSALKSNKKKKKM